MKRKLLVLAMALLLTGVSSFGQTLTRYTKRCGKTLTDVVYKEVGADVLEIEIGSQKSIHHFDSRHCNTSWTIIDSSCGMDVTIILEDGTYHIVGKSDGKEIDRTVKSGGSPWIQNLAYFCGVLVPEDGVLEYECFRPGSFSLHQMTASIDKEESTETKTCVRARPAGIASKLFHAEYFFSPQSRKLNGYRAVEGIPGTPEVTWVPAE